MRRLAFAVLLAASLTTSACMRPGLIEPAGITPVDVTITCTGGGVQSDIDPYVVQIPEGNVAEWKLTPASTVTEMEINRKKSGAAWPYDGPLPYKGTKIQPPKSGKMKAGQYGKTFRYNISATCTSASGEARKIIIDPDMIIIRRLGTT